LVGAYSIALVRNKYKIIVGEHRELRQFGRPKVRLEYSFKMGRVSGSGLHQLGLDSVK
jgi:hypothetical protein